jgi:hypothetical protein
VKVVVVPPPRPHFLEPGTIVSGLAAQRLFDGRVDEYPLHQWVLCKPMMLKVAGMNGSP